MVEYPDRILKMILTEDTESTGLVLPDKFIKQHGEDLLERVTLKVRNADAWKVGLLKSEGHIWLKRGWAEFAEFYGIRFGYVLQFIYEGSSTFRVTIFSASATEIVYPCQKEYDDYIRRAKIVDETKTQASGYGFKTVKSEDETSGDETSEDGNNRIKKNDGGECSRKRGRKLRKKDETRNVKNAGELSEKERRKGRMRAGRKKLEKLKAKFKCGKPFFLTCITQSYVARKRGVFMPAGFRDKLFRSLRHSDFNHKCLLQLEDDGAQNTWMVYAGDTYLGEGDWLKFVKDNGIKSGDVCVFKLLNKHENVIGVRLYKSDS